MHTWNGDKGAKDSDDYGMDDGYGGNETRNYTTKMQEFTLRSDEEEEEELEARYTIRRGF